MLFCIVWEKCKKQSQQSTIATKSRNFDLIFRDKAAAKSMLTDMKRPEFFLFTLILCN